MKFKDFIAAWGLSIEGVMGPLLLRGGSRDGYRGGVGVFQPRVSIPWGVFVICMFVAAPIESVARPMHPILSLTASATSIRLGESATIRSRYIWGTDGRYAEMDLSINGELIDSYMAGGSDRSYSFVYTPTQPGRHRVVLSPNGGVRPDSSPLELTIDVIGATPLGVLIHAPANAVRIGEGYRLQSR